jgi:hypothetical protein
MPNTFQLIASSTVPLLGATSIDFTSIPADYTDLCLKVSARNDAVTTVGGIWIQFNGFSTNLSSRVLFGTGSSSGSFSDTTIFSYCNAALSTTSTFSNLEFYISNYAGSNNKTMTIDSTMENDATGSSMALTAGRWSASAAITSIKLLTFNNSNSAAANFVQNSTAYLYGVKKP